MGDLAGQKHTKIRAYLASLSLDRLYGRYTFRTQLPNFGQGGRCAYQNIHSFIPQKAFIKHSTYRPMIFVCFAPEKRLCLNSISTEGISNNFSQNEKDILHTLELIIIIFTNCKRISLIIGTSYCIDKVHLSYCEANYICSYMCYFSLIPKQKTKT